MHKTVYQWMADAWSAKRWKSRFRHAPSSSNYILLASGAVKSQAKHIHTQTHTHVLVARCPDKHPTHHRSKAGRSPPQTDQTPKSQSWIDSWIIPKGTHHQCATAGARFGRSCGRTVASMIQRGKPACTLEVNTPARTTTSVRSRCFALATKLPWKSTIVCSVRRNNRDHRRVSTVLAFLAPGFRPDDAGVVKFTPRFYPFLQPHAASPSLADNLRA
ncbi:acyl-CoA dehydrogenase domain-containing protein [Anopheles sinensis]|uniref:Acyl-CoA dehydrogenase domain-containing protein n=1 Tax=Anopheles sinensis TaxID=74873 RepID=A0A084W7V1_ANOSI|nr:acyl-CoA dehydrogenase domain-containing protein [Anopheles sinensis]